VKVIYVAGPYNSKTEWGLEINLRKAEDAARELWKMGWAVICPHKNTAHFGGLLDNPMEDRNMWLSGDLEILSRCDAVLRLDGESQGADEEVKLALELGIPVYYSIEAIRRFN